MPDDQQERRDKLAPVLRQARRARKLTQVQLAEAIGVDQSAISKYETAKIAPEDEQRRALERELHLTDGTLLAILEPEAMRATNEEIVSRLGSLEQRVAELAQVTGGVASDVQALRRELRPGRRAPKQAEG